MKLQFLFLPLLLMGSISATAVQFPVTNCRIYSAEEIALINTKIQVSAFQYNESTPLVAEVRLMWKSLSYYNIIDTEVAINALLVDHQLKLQTLESDDSRKKAQVEIKGKTLSLFQAGKLKATAVCD